MDKNLYVILRGGRYLKTCSSLEKAKGFVYEMDNVKSYIWTNLFDLHWFVEDQLDKDIEELQWSIILDNLDSEELFTHKYAAYIAGASD